jgi:hypothetical protein
MTVGGANWRQLFVLEKEEMIGLREKTTDHFDTQLSVARKGL